MEVLGQLVSKKGVRVDAKKISAIELVPHPWTNTQHRAFLETCSFHRRFISGFATIAAPLHQQTAKEEAKEAKKGEFSWWIDEALVAFLALKDRLASPPVLAFLDYTRPVEVMVYGSRKSVGTVLKQADAERKNHLVQFARRKLTPAEKKLQHLRAGGSCVRL